MYVNKLCSMSIIFWTQLVVIALGKGGRNRYRVKINQTLFMCELSTNYYQLIIIRYFNPKNVRTMFMMLLCHKYKN